MRGGGRRRTVNRQHSHNQLLVRVKRADLFVMHHIFYRQQGFWLIKKPGQRDCDTQVGLLGPPQSPFYSRIHIVDKIDQEVVREVNQDSGWKTVPEHDPEEEHAGEPAIDPP